MRDRLPLAFFGAIGAVLAAFGAAAELAVLAHFFVTGATSPYQSLTILGAVFLMLGAVSFLIALLADMLGRMRQTQEMVLYMEKRRYYDDLTEDVLVDIIQDAPMFAQRSTRAQEAQLALPLRRA